MGGWVHTQQRGLKGIECAAMRGRCSSKTSTSRRPIPSPIAVCQPDATAPACLGHSPKQGGSQPTAAARHCQLNASVEQGEQRGALTAGKLDIFCLQALSLCGVVSGGGWRCRPRGEATRRLGGWGRSAAYSRSKTHMQAWTRTCTPLPGPAHTSLHPIQPANQPASQPTSKPHLFVSLEEQRKQAPIGMVASHLNASHPTQPSVK